MNRFEQAVHDCMRIEEVDPAEATTPARVRDIHREQLARLEQERGDKFWIPDGA